MELSFLDELERLERRAAFDVRRAWTAAFLPGADDDEIPPPRARGESSPLLWDRLWARRGALTGARADLALSERLQPGRLLLVLTEEGRVVFRGRWKGRPFEGGRDVYFSPGSFEWTYATVHEDPPGSVFARRRPADPNAFSGDGDG